jgi:hypothetical protein
MFTTATILVGEMVLDRPGELRRAAHVLPTCERRFRPLLMIPAVLMILVGTLYVWPLNSDAVRRAPAAGWTFDESQRPSRPAPASAASSPTAPG